MLFSIYCLNLKQFKTVQYRIQARTDTTGTVGYLTDTQSINKLLMSRQCIEIIYARDGKKEDFPPHTATVGTESKG